MSGDFIDSNVFVYLVDGPESGKRDVARQLVADLLESGDGSISWQVVQETLNVVTSKISRPLTGRHALEFAESRLFPFWTV